MNGNGTNLNISTIGDLTNVKEVRVGARETEVDQFTLLSDTDNFMTSEALAMTEGPITASIRYRGASAKTQYVNLKTKQADCSNNGTTFTITATDKEGTTHTGVGFISGVSEIVYVGNQPVEYTVTLTPENSWTPVAGT